jgi:hypothetical protein
MRAVERRAAAAAADLRARVMAGARAALPGIAVEEAAGGVLLSGRGLVARVLARGSAATWLR